MTTPIRRPKSPIVQVQANERLGYESRRGTESWAVIIEQKVVVDRFWNMDGAEFVTGLLGVLVDDSHGVGGVVSADIEEIADVMLLHDFEHPRAILVVWLVARREERG
jgi:hypothetical protein